MTRTSCIRRPAQAAAVLESGRGSVGLRPAMRTMGKRLAGIRVFRARGQSVLSGRKTTATGATPIQQMMPFRKGMSPATDVSDAKTFVASS